MNKQIKKKPTQFQIILEKISKGELDTPTVMINGGMRIDYVAFQLIQHKSFILQMFLNNEPENEQLEMIKEYYGLNGTGIQECLEQLEIILQAYELSVNYN